MGKSFTPQEAEKFVKENLVSANDSRVACGDGRYTPEQSKGGVRAFGADFGLIMAFATALKDEGTHLVPSEIIERYSRAKKQEFGDSVKLEYHCDLEHHEKGEIGCGHIKQAVDPKNDGGYGSITSNEVNDLFEEFTKRSDSEVTVLEGKHEEKAILLVHGEDDEVAYSVNSQNKKGEMYFVADIDRTISLIKKMTPKFSQGLQKTVNPDDVILNYLRQMDQTAKQIASDKDRFKVVLTNDGKIASMNQLRRERPQQSA